MRPRVGVLSWHSNSSCSLWMFLSLVPVRFFCFLFDSSRTARHLLVRALPNSSILIHCTPSVTCDTRFEVGLLVEINFSCRRSLSRRGMVLVKSPSIHPSSTHRVLFLYYSPPFLAGEVVVMSSRHTTIVVLGDCCRLS